MFWVASYNVENLFARPKVFNLATWSAGLPVLKAYREVNELFQKDSYSATDKRRMRDLLVTLDIYSVNDNGAVRRRLTTTPKWAWFRRNRGQFDLQPRDSTQDVEIIADGRDQWTGWVELATEPTDKVGIRLTARVIKDVNADIIGIVEAENRPSLVSFNDQFLDGLYDHVMLIDGNDDRGIDVAIMTRPNFEIESMRSNVDLEDSVGSVQPGLPAIRDSQPEWRNGPRSGEPFQVAIGRWRRKTVKASHGCPTDC